MVFSYKKKKKKKRNLRDTSSESEDEDIIWFPTFIVLESQDGSPLVNLFPFVIEKVLSANQPKTVKKLKNGNLLVEVERKKNMPIFCWKWRYFHTKKIIPYRCCIVICWFMQKYTYIYWTQTDAMITDAIINDARRKTHEVRRKTSLPIFYLSLYCKGSKGLFKGCVWEGAGNRTWTVISWPHCYDRHVVSFLFSWCWGPLHRGSEDPPRSGVAFLTTSGL